MEEDKKEEVMEDKSERKHSMCFHNGCQCKGHKIIRAIFLAFVIFAIFAVGVCFGARLGNREYGHQRNFRNFEPINFEEGSRMMPNNFRGRMMLNQRYDNGQQIEVQATTQDDGPATIQVVTPNAIQKVTPAATSTIIQAK